MQASEIVARLNAHLIEGEMIHSQMRDYWDFFGYLNGFKRQQEYQIYKEIKDRVKLNMWYVNHYNELIHDMPVSNPEVIPASFYTMTRANLNGNSKNYIKAGIERWYSWESETLEFLKGLMAEADDECIYLKLEKMIKDVSCELKKVTRLWLKCKAVDYEISELVLMQDKMHCKYRKNIRKLFDGRNRCK